ncbi:sodium:solute symporter family protein [Aliifodinibius sp. S!AR15-10]|uniref:sodium:solute symporter family protein n=1 Tax=Aliifodinibius sp. S!AR15-10 TaxID=2950437 RepID=UPI0028672E68|nr:sodium:solute symporter family protein [Aliifodinibius sp. S!AR15-10]MDR8394417.1 sodium:solute symporter family protein [Aliifodinibius sp. S!AR15-10]
MHWIDLTIFILYMIALLGFGLFFFKHNKGADDYYVGGRKMSSLHVGLSVVATDVGGGFSIGLGGLGFVMGVSGSWMLFTGLLGAWMAAVLLIPKVKGNKVFDKAYTFPEIFKYYFNPHVALVAGVISAVGYAGFTSSQILAGAKLANGTFANLDLQTALIIMGSVAVLYTVMGGLKAVIYTDTIQWAILMIGLIFIGLPVSYTAIGGWEAIQSSVDPSLLSMSNLTWQKVVYWGVTIIPIWFVGMTLYQRIYACNDEKTAKRAWYMAGLFEWPVMAFMGVFLGLFAKVAAAQGMFDYLGAANISETDPETGLPMLLRTVLPVGLMGIMMSAYFSAILSTADSCLMAASGNVVSDIIGYFTDVDHESDKFLRFSQVTTLIIGSAALLIATSMTSVLDMMLYSYAFMVSGLFVPTIGALYWDKSSSFGAIAAMLLGGGTTVSLEVFLEQLPAGLDANVFGISASAIAFIALSMAFPDQKEREPVLDKEDIEVTEELVNSK